MATRTAFAEQDFAAGERESATFDVADSDGFVAAVLDGDDLAALPAGADVLGLTVHVSLDGGTTWEEWCGATVRGGTKRDKIGRVDNVSAVSRRLPAVPGRKVRVRLDARRALRAAVAVVTGAPGGAASSSERHNSVTFDAAASTQGKNVGSLTVGITVANQANRVLLADGILDDGVSMDWSGCVFNTTETMTEWAQTADADTGGGVGWAIRYRLAAPSVTTANVVMSYTGTAYNAALLVTGYYGAHQSDFDTPETSVGTTTDPSETCAGYDGGIAVAVFYAGNNNFAEVSLSSTDGTQRAVEDTSESSLDVSAGIVLTEDGSAGGNSLAADATGHAIWAALMVCLKPAAADGQPTVRRLALAGRGGHRPVEVGRHGGAVMRRAA